LSFIFLTINAGNLNSELLKKQISAKIPIIKIASTTPKTFAQALEQVLKLTTHSTIPIAKMKS